MTLLQALLIVGSFVALGILLAVVVTWEDWWPRYWDRKDRKRGES